MKKYLKYQCYFFLFYFIFIFYYYYFFFFSGGGGGGGGGGGRERVGVVGGEGYQKNFSRTQNRITKTYLFKYIENFTTINLKILYKNSDIFHIFAQNRDCGYSLFVHISAQNIDCGYPQSIFFEQK